MAKLAFKIDNPAKYKVGNKHQKVWVITDVFLAESHWVSAEQSEMFMPHSLFGCVKPKYFWRYNATNTKTGEIKII